MITVDHDAQTVTLAVIGEFTLADFTEFEEYLIANDLFDGSHNLLFDLTEMAGFTVDVALEEIKFTRLHGGDFKKIAVVTDSQWLAWSAWLEKAFVAAELRVFDDVNDARAWLAEEQA
ncbi:STAS/SEC14 domain-containing protein [Sulfuricystis multivorans]|uniref:STAS/SEC14 domain-containing protein n=1 Tax=Sulfuricystis multivorans TaxID=2211108 RepID=UPI000F81D3A4|nr:STAS/SEC14 domain-containing protein [Sulfuricystis multivorans]